jgi:hypothetical protein
MLGSSATAGPVACSCSGLEGNSGANPVLTAQGLKVTPVPSPLPKPVPQAYNSRGRNLSRPDASGRPVMHTQWHSRTAKVQSIHIVGPEQSLHNATTVKSTAVAAWLKLQCPSAVCPMRHIEPRQGPIRPERMQLCWAYVESIAAREGQAALEILSDTKIHITTVRNSNCLHSPGR